MKIQLLHSTSITFPMSPMIKIHGRNILEHKDIALLYWQLIFTRVCQLVKQERKQQGWGKDVPKSDGVRVPQKEAL